MKLTLTAIAISLIALTSQAQRWELLTPMNVDDIVRNCSFLDEQNGYSVLQSAGTVLKTTDGGQSWSRPWTPGMSPNLYDVEMVSIDTVFTAGVSGEIFRSTDEGESFQEMTTPTSEYLYALEFIDSQIGFAAGFNGVIIKTVDGGTTWEVKETGTTNRLFDIEFVDENNGFACGWNGTVLKTTDQGETWEILDTQHDGALFNCTFPTAQVGYACGFSQTILKTSDGGETWEVQNDGSINTLNYIEFKDELNGWAVGDFGAFFTTSNGGATWNSSTPFGGSALWSGQYVSEDAAFIMGRGIMIKSENDATNWELLKNGVPNSTYHGLHFFSDEVGYAAGRAGALGEGSDRAGIVFTEDGGQTWQQQHIGFSGGWLDIHFSDENHGTVIGGATFGKTSNGGENWTFTPIPFDLTSRCTWFFNESEGVIGGQGVFSSVCKTQDGGSSYNCQDNTLATDFYFTSDLNGWAVGEAGSENILHTEDGGETWLYIPTGNFQTKHSVFFLDEDHGWVGAANGSVLRTTDGGDTWSFSNAGGTVIGIRFYDENIGFCADQQGNVWRSADGGATWELFLSGDDPTFSPFEEAHFTENTVYIGGWSGDIYKAELGCTDIAPAQIFSTDQWCPGEENTIGFSSTTPVVDFEWEFPEGWDAQVNFSTVNLTAGSSGGEIELTTTNACGLTANSQLTVQVLPEVQAISGLDFPDGICSNVSFDISILGAQAGVEYDWSWPSDWDVQELGTVLSVTNPESSGTVSISAENDCGVAPDYEESITVLEAPDLTFELQESVCDNETLTLSAIPEGGVFSGEGVSGTTFDPLMLSGESVELTYSFVAENNCTASDIQTINLTPSAINGGEWLNFEYPPCGGELLLEFGEIENVDSWNLTFPDDWGAFIDGGTELPSGSIDEVLSNGDVELALSNECGVEVIFTNSVELLEAPEDAVLQSAVNEWCEGQEGEAVFTVGSSDSLIISEASLDYVLVQVDSLASLVLSGNAGEQFITVFSQNACGQSDPLTVEFEVLSLPELTFSLPGDTLCTEQGYLFTAEPPGGEIDGIGESGGLFQTFFLNPFTNYDFTYTYTDSLGCTAMDSLSVYLDICSNVSENEKLEFSIYPNPAQDFLVVETYEVLPMEFIIHDMKGRLIQTGFVHENFSEIDIRDLSVGSYLFSLGNVKQRFVVR